MNDENNENEVEEDSTFDGPAQVMLLISEKFQN